MVSSVQWLGTKFLRTYQELRELPDDDVVLFTDAFDAIYTDAGPEVCVCVCGA